MKVIIDGKEYLDTAGVVEFNAAQGTPIVRRTVYWYITQKQLLPDLYNGRMPLFTSETVAAFFQPDRQSGKKKLRSPGGYYSIEELADALGEAYENIRYFINAGAITPDYVPTRGKNKGRAFFNAETLEAMRRGDHRLRAKKPPRTPPESDQSEVDVSEAETD